MLGTENGSHVPLEVFGQRFQLVQTIGRLANIAAECGEIDRVAEGHLKSFTGGDRMTLDRKNKPAVEFSPTARLIIAMNNRPRFSDRSKGLWRRMIVVPFRLEVPEERRILGMDKVSWWQCSGELSGIFNWALTGLVRLRDAGRFTDSKICRAAAEDFRLESNPALGFLRDRVESNSQTSTPCSELYTAYKKWCDEHGYRPLGERLFGKEVIRAFPGTVRQKIGPRANRPWSYSGIMLLEDENNAFT
jgi:P4 family phage/plasmid primase-like protien